MKNIDKATVDTLFQSIYFSGLQHAVWRRATAIYDVGLHDSTDLLWCCPFPCYEYEQILPMTSGFQYIALSQNEQSEGWSYKK